MIKTSHSIIIIVIMLIIVLVPSSFGIVYDIKPTCANNVCIEGDIASFEVTLSSGDNWNKDTNSITFASITLRDKQFGLLIGRENVNTVITKDSSKTIILSGILPAPTNNHNLYYVPCFDRTINYSYTDTVFGITYPMSTNDYNNCGTDSLVMEVYPLSEVECRTNSECGSEAKCVGVKCSKLECTENEGYLDHSCVNLNCLDNQIIENHYCVDLKCKWYQTTNNHNCVFNWGNIQFYVVGLFVLFVAGLFARKKMMTFFQKKETK